MKIIQLNIWQGKIGNQIADFLKAEQPDIVCMQEVFELKGHSNGTFSSIEELNAIAGFKHLSIAPTYSFHYQNRTCRSANVVASNFPIAHEEVMFVSGEYKENFDRTEHDYNVRNMQTLKFELPSQKQLTVVNHHAYHIYNDQGDDTSIKAMQKVVDHVKSQHGPIIVCGDFNVSPDTQAMQAWKDSDLRNLVVENKITNTLGKLHYLDRDVVCDYIFVNPDIKVRSLKAKDPLVSDHKALILEFDV